MNVFERVQVPHKPKKADVAKKQPILTGIWETVGFEQNGDNLKKINRGVPFLKNQMIFYFQDNFCTLFENKKSGLSMSILRQPYQMKPNEGINAIDFQGKPGKALALRFMN